MDPTASTSSRAQRAARRSRVARRRSHMAAERDEQKHDAVAACEHPSFEQEATKVRNVDSSPELETLFVVCVLDVLLIE